MRARIYKPSKSTMQSARGRTKEWVLEIELETPRAPEALMGWIASGDTNNQIKLTFDSSELAVQYATEKGWDYTVSPCHERIVRPRNYADNFRYIPPAEDATSK